VQWSMLMWMSYWQKSKLKFLLMLLFRTWRCCFLVFNVGMGLWGIYLSDDSVNIVSHHHTLSARNYFISLMKYHHRLFANTRHDNTSLSRRFLGFIFR
jgi:hypothetical protein